MLIFKDFAGSYPPTGLVSHKISDKLTAIFWEISTQKYKTKEKEFFRYMEKREAFCLGNFIVEPGQRKDGFLLMGEGGNFSFLPPFYMGKSPEKQF